MAPTSTCAVVGREAPPRHKKAHGYRRTQIFCAHAHAMAHAHCLRHIAAKIKTEMKKLHTPKHGTHKHTRGGGEGGTAPA